MGLTHLNAARPREKSSGVPHCGSSKILSDLVSHRRATRQVSSVETPKQVLRQMLVAACSCVCCPACPSSRSCSAACSCACSVVCDASERGCAGNISVPVSCFSILFSACGRSKSSPCPHARCGSDAVSVSSDVWPGRVSGASLSMVAVRSGSATSKARAT